MKHLVFICVLLLSGCMFHRGDLLDLDEVPLKPVADVDLDRYMGRWYLIANIPYFAERNNVAAYVEYRRGDDGLIEDDFSARKSFDQPRFVKKGEIEIFPDTHNAEGRITFNPFPGQDFTVLYVDKHYQYTVIGHPSRNFCWVFARQPAMPDEAYYKLLRVLSDNAFDVSRVLKIPHRPEQQGTPGYQ